MKGDFSRITFAPEKNFLRVLMQQGRVQLDADWNEQTAILLHYLQTLAADLIGPYAGPKGDNLGFEIARIGEDTGDFSIGKGRYYVDGVLCENHTELTYFTQPDYPLDAKTEPLSAQVYLVYLDVWERHISDLEDNDIREQALRGIDTATRSKVLWQVKVKPQTDGQYWRAWQDGVEALKQDEVVLSEACLRARVKPVEAEPDACCQSPEAKYRGLENQLYRIEIHNTGETPTFKWSRENGAVVFPVTGIAADAASKTLTVALAHLGRDDKLGLAVNDWVELLDDDSVLKNKAAPLCQVDAIDAIAGTVVLKGKNAVVYDQRKHPLLRRWDQKAGADGIAIPDKTEWLSIEAGIEVEFKRHDGQVLRTGDYWLIPARIESGEIEWPAQRETDGSAIVDHDGRPIPAFISAQGVEHRYAPLAFVTVTGNTMLVYDCRCTFSPLSYDCQYSYYGRLGQGIGTQLLCPDDAA